MVDVPAECGVITPVDEFIVALAPSEEVHDPPPSVLSKVVDPLEHNSWVPLNSPALTGSATVIVSVSIASAQPPEPVTVYVIVASPADWAVMSPGDAFRVAMSVSNVDHVPESPIELNVVVLVEHISCVPIHGPALKGAVTVTICMAVAVGQPPKPVTV